MLLGQFSRSRDAMVCYQTHRTHVLEEKRANAERKNASGFQKRSSPHASPAAQGFTQGPHADNLHHADAATVRH